MVMKIAVSCMTLTIIAFKISRVVGQWNSAAQPIMRFLPSSYPGNTVGVHRGAYPGGYIGFPAPSYPGIIYPKMVYPLPGYPVGLVYPMGSYLAVPVLYSNSNSGKKYVKRTYVCV